MKQKSLIILIVVFVLVMVGAGAAYHFLGDDLAPDQLATVPQQTEASEPAGDGSEPQETEPAPLAAPDFSVRNQKGEMVRLSDFKGKPVVLNFWASWCGPCRMEMPHFQKAYEKYGEDIQFLMVNATDGYKETMDSADALIIDEGYTFPVFYDTEYEASMAYGTNSLPMTFFIDADGFLQGYARGSISANVIEEGISRIYTD